MDKVANLVEQIDGSWVVRKAGDPDCTEHFAESLEDAILYCSGNRIAYEIRALPETLPLTPRGDAMALVMFVGGPIDGETKDIEGQPEYIDIPYRAAGSTEFPDLPRFNAATYRFARKHAAGRNSTGFYQYQRG